MHKPNSCTSSTSYLMFTRTSRAGTLFILNTMMKALEVCAYENPDYRGAGFIGSHVADELIANGYHVRILDNLSPQVHGGRTTWPEYVNGEAELMRGDVRDSATVERALRGIDAVYHFAAAVGVGQSMYEVEKYTSINNIGTAVLLEALIKKPVQKLIVASSMSIYGEGLYANASGQPREFAGRTLEQLKTGQWEALDEQGNLLTPIPTPETKTPSLASVYALSKYDQERLCLMIGRAYQIPTVALRFFNVYGTRQSLSNPYTGVLAIFASRFLNDKPPLIYEDGMQKRDFVSVQDIARACRLALESDAATDQVINIGGGQPYTIREIAARMARVLGKSSIAPVVNGKYRVGDIRHCFGDISRGRKLLGYEPRITLEAGLVELAQWLERQTACDMVDQANAELAQRGLTV